MPKLIENLRERLLAQTRSVLLDQGLDALSIRDVAAACGVAAGTVYNYFPSKEDLVAHAILGDWAAQMTRLSEEVGRCATLDEGFRAIRACIEGFSARYSLAFSQAPIARTDPAFAARHAMLREQIEGVTDGLLSCFGRRATPVSLYVMAETLLAAASHGWADDEVLDVLERLATPKEEIS